MSVTTWNPSRPHNERPNSYHPIADYGIIGDTRGMALVNRHGGIDYCSLPHLDSPPFFLKMLDAERGGTFDIYPVDDDYRVDRRYIDDSNVLKTKFSTAEGEVELIDCFVVPGSTEQEEEPPHQILRLLECHSGRMDVTMCCRVTPDFARQQARATQEDGNIVWRWDGGEAWFAGNWDVEIDPDQPDTITATMRMRTGDRLVAVVSDSQPVGVSPTMVGSHVHRAINFWRAWVRGCPYVGMYRDMVIRSALTLKLLTFRPTGAIVAAPTTSLPEHIGGERNWDYRYCWLRDSALTLWSFGLIGFVDEAHEFMHWILDRCFTDEDEVQIMYGLRGERDLTEYTLDHLSGYRNSRPVRAGNGAYQQKQLDIYGEILDTAYLFYVVWGGLERYSEYRDRFEGPGWESFRNLADQVVERWMEKDAGIWEVRGEKQHFVYSKFMCWVALHRAIKIAERFDLPADLDTWRSTRDEIKRTVMERGYNEEIGAFTQTFDGDALDASVLLMPMVHFIRADHPKMASTIDRVNEHLMPNGLVYRYLTEETDDGLSGDEGAFTMCSFWMVDNLVFRGEVSEARELFAGLIAHANDLGLYSEEIHPETGEFLGNFPQAFTHMALINAAINLDKAERRIAEGTEGPLRPGVRREVRARS
ncbi:MAG: glycoside hydrolase family 15 protein [Chloroflexota bacterium]